MSEFTILFKPFFLTSYQRGDAPNHQHHSTADITRKTISSKFCKTLSLFLLKFQIDYTRISPQTIMVLIIIELKFYNIETIEPTKENPYIQFIIELNVFKVLKI